jgi:hypothetical protein
MSTMNDPKSTVYAKLKEIETLTVDGHVKTVQVYQPRPQELDLLEDSILITFATSGDKPQYDIEGDIMKQDSQMRIDLWGLTSLDTTALLTAVESKMREIEFLLEDAFDTGDPKGYSHKVCIFNF